MLRLARDAPVPLAWDGGAQEDEAFFPPSRAAVIGRTYGKSPEPNPRAVSATLRPAAGSSLLPGSTAQNCRT